MLKKVDKLIIKEFIAPFALTFAITVFILFYQFISTELNNLLGKNLGFWNYAKIIFYFCIGLVPAASALSVLLSSLMTFGSLGQHSEIVAIKGAGVSLPRILLPAFFVILIITLVSFIFNNTVVPKAHLKLQKMMISLQEKRPTLELSDGVFYNGLPGYSIKVDSKSKDGNQLYGLMIYDHTDENGNTVVTLAERGKIAQTKGKRYMVMELFNGSSFTDQINFTQATPSEKKTQSVRNQFDYGKIYMDLQKSKKNRTTFYLERKMMPMHTLLTHYDSAYEAFSQLKTKLAQKTIPALKQPTAGSSTHKKETVDKQALILQDIDLAKEKVKAARAFINEQVNAIREERRQVRSYLVEIMRRYVDVAAMLVMFLIGAPIGTIVKKGGLGMPILLATIFFSTYSFMLNFGVKAAKEDALPIWVGCWASSFIIALIGLFFLNQARKDTGIFDIDFYLTTFTRIFKMRET